MMAGHNAAPNSTRFFPSVINYAPSGRIVVGTDGRGTVEDLSDGAMELDLV